MADRHAEPELPPISADGLRHWLVAGGVVVDDGSCLLVQNRRRNGLLDWSTPGGVIDPGEALLAGLGREVAEETGLAVTDWHGPLYRVEVIAPGFGFHLRAEAHRALGFAGSIVIDDPDGIVVEAEFVTVDVAAQRLADAPRWVSEPLLEHLREGVDDGRLYAYRLEGDGARNRRVVRL